MPYLKFLSLVQALRQMPGLPKLDASEERLLNNLAGSWYKGKKVTVLEAMNAQDDVSASTVHRKLKVLRKKGLIELVNDEIDNRIKYIVGTPLSNKYFAQMEKCLVKSGK